jgi:CheY-like chemotaxis protein
VSLTVRLAAPDDGAAAGARLSFAVADTGPGIDKEAQEKLFEAFTTVARMGEALEGTGLGLSISREFVRLMGGEIAVQSAPGEGATFSFEANVAIAEASEVKQEADDRTVLGLAEGQPAYRILVADDQWENRDLLLQLLISVGFDVQGAQNGEEAVLAWQRWEPHLIWMDMRMPVMDGYEATKRIKATLRGQATVIIAITASAFEHDRAMVHAAGCDDFVRKPFRDTEIFDKMARHIGVRYRYSDAPIQQPPAPRDALSVESLALLPEGLRCDLRRAATSLSVKAVNGVLGQVRGLDPFLADALAGLVRGYRFDRIISLIDGERG